MFSNNENLRFLKEGKFGAEMLEIINKKYAGGLGVPNTTTRI